MTERLNDKTHKAHSFESSMNNTHHALLDSQAGLHHIKASMAQSADSPSAKSILPPFSLTGSELNNKPADKASGLQQTSPATEPKFIDPEPFSRKGHPDFPDVKLKPSDTKPWGPEILPFNPKQPWLE